MTKVGDERGQTKCLIIRSRPLGTMMVQDHDGTRPLDSFPAHWHNDLLLVEQGDTEWHDLIAFKTDDPSELDFLRRSRGEKSKRICSLFFVEPGVGKLCGHKAKTKQRTKYLRALDCATRQIW